MIPNVWGKLRTLNDNGVLDALTFAVTMGGIVYYVDYTNGDDSLDGLSIGTAVKNLSTAYGLLRTGKHDCIVLVSDPSTTAKCTVRVDSAFTWDKAATHLIGQASPLVYGQRARVAPTPSTTAFANFFTVSASGCMFINIEWFQGFTVGIAGTEIGMTVTGSRNYFKNCQIVGMADTDAGSAAGTGSRHLKIGSAGSGENLFEDCVIGEDTVSRSVANASVEFAGGTPRNVFRRCIFPIYATNAGVLGILGTGNACVDRFNEFRDCTFTNAIKSAATQMTVLGSFTTASPGGAIIFSGWCFSIGSTKLGDTNFLANSYVCGPAVNSGAFLGIVPA
jgi:hypothetical protein